MDICTSQRDTVKGAALAAWSVEHRLIARFWAIQTVYNGSVLQARVAAAASISAKSGSREMDKNETREILLKDIDGFRQKATYYESLRLFEAARYAKRLASNIELALTTMPTDDDPQIS
jgi:hypothetical protein